MAEGQVKQVLEEELTCALCLDLFKEPKKLPCDHVYCRDCLRSLALRSQNASISCPECHTLIQIPDSDINNFPTAFRVNRLIEAFQQVHIREENKSHNVTEMCHIHPTQQLAIYCGTCKKQLCRDCVLMTQEHANHEYGFFKEMITKYREKFASEISLIKTQETSISIILQEITSEDKKLGTSNCVQQCQDDVEQAFEQLISVLHACKQALKDEAMAYYGSFTGDCEQQREQLKAIQSEIKSVVASVDTTSDGNCSSFFTRMESTFEKISNLQKEFQAVSLTVPKPWQITLKSMDAAKLRQYVKANCYFHKPADAKMCTIAFTNPKQLLYVGEQTLTLTLRDSRGNASTGENNIEIYLLPPQGNIIMGVIPVQPLSEGHMKVSLTPFIRGPHQLHVKVNGAHIRYSPFTVTVCMPPNLLSQPVATIVEFARPVSLAYSQAEDKVFATVTHEGTIAKVDSQFHLEIIRFPQVNEITHGVDMNIFYVTTTDNRLHKMLNDGRIAKTVGRFGKWNGEFNFPNGLRVNKRCELYVCDSRNHRVQVFDLDLNFMRSFGRKGAGQGQFNSPADVDFDSVGNIYVTELDNNRIQVFTPTECHIRIIIPSNQSFGIIAFRPVSLLMHDENIYVTDANNHKVWVMNTSGQVVATFGDGFLRRPEGITIDRAGFIYVTSDHSKILKF